MNNPALPNGLDLRSLAFGFSRQDKAQEKTSSENAAQPIDITRFGRENPRKSKLFQPSKTGVRGQKATRQENPNDSIRPWGYHTDNR